MNVKQAIEWIKAISAVQTNSFNSDTLVLRKEALHMGIKPLMKEDPKKPFIYTDVNGTSRYGCQGCLEHYNRREILFPGQKYCSVCGQRIEW